MGKEKDTKINHTVYNIEDVGQLQLSLVLQQQK